MKIVFYKPKRMYSRYGWLFAAKLIWTLYANIILAIYYLIVGVLIVLPYKIIRAMINYKSNKGKEI